jgi:hypothetical protein
MEVAFFLPFIMVTGILGSKLANADCQTVLTMAGHTISAGKCCSAAEAVASVFPTLGSSAKIQRPLVSRNSLDTSWCGSSSIVQLSFKLAFNISHNFSYMKINFML